MDDDEIQERLEDLRDSIRAENISFGELAELTRLAAHIAPGDVELLEWAGRSEFSDDDDDERGTFTLTIDCGNAAFADEYELPQLIHEVAHKVQSATAGYGPVIDSNGNTVGSWEIS